MTLLIEEPLQMVLINLDILFLNTIGVRAFRSTKTDTNRHRLRACLRAHLPLKPLRLKSSAQLHSGFSNRHPSTQHRRRQY